MPRTTFCDGFSRRNLLRIGVAAPFGLGVTLPSLLAGEMQPAAGQDAKKAKDGASLIILFLKGGLSTIDTFDLKPHAPAEIRGEFNPIATNVPGIQIGEHLPKV